MQKAEELGGIVQETAAAVFIAKQAFTAWVDSGLGDASSLEITEQLPEETVWNIPDKYRTQQFVVPVLTTDGSG